MWPFRCVHVINKLGTPVLTSPVLGIHKLGTAVLTSSVPDINKLGTPVLTSTQSRTFDNCPLMHFHTKRVFTVL